MQINEIHRTQTIGGDCCKTSKHSETTGLVSCCLDFILIGCYSCSVLGFVLSLMLLLTSRCPSRERKREENERKKRGRVSGSNE